LNALSLNTELLSDELLLMDDDKRSEAWEILGIMAKEIGRLTDVTAHYLQLARRPRPELGAIDLPAVVQDVVRLVQPELDQRGVALDLDLDPLQPLVADGNQLRQALLNVMRNAVEAGATSLDVALRRHGAEARLSIRDDGPGMTPEEVERACDPFYSTKSSGTGLGLAITRQILEDQHGTIRIRSEPGQGTEFVLVLPADTATHVTLPATS